MAEQGKIAYTNLNGELREGTVQVAVAQYRILRVRNKGVWFDTFEVVNIDVDPAKSCGGSTYLTNARTMVVDLLNRDRERYGQ